MKKYVLLFRMDILTESAQPDEAQMNSYMVSWMKWINSISAKGNRWRQPFFKSSDSFNFQVFYE